MPYQPSTTQARFTNILTFLGPAVDTLEVISKTLETPFLQVIWSTMHSLLSVVQTIKKNQDVCTQMLEQIHDLLQAIIYAHVKSNTRGELSPHILDDLGKFTETLHKIHTFIEAEQEKSRIKQFFRQGEMKTLLMDCHLGLEQALEAFKFQGVDVLNDMTEMQKYAQKTHEEVLELISVLSDGGSSDSASLMSRTVSNFQNRILIPTSSNSLSLLPSEPKIFHGRDSEVSAIIHAFGQGTPRHAILGAGGMGKTSIARAVIHHPVITSRYKEHRFFVGCDSASNNVQLAALIGGYVGLEPAKDLTRPVIHHFSHGLPCLLILDNLETVWEPAESRAEVEKFLGLLADIPHLALVITMRGAERPANIRWTRPFLEPLQPLAQDAARKTFVDITDDGYLLEDIDKILNLTDNMPLAIDLMAHLVDVEGVPSVLHRWETGKTSLGSEGHDKGSNLDVSIFLSLASPRITSVPQAKDLLGLLSILPDGLSDIELVQSKLPIANILGCKTALLRTSLAYTDDQKRLKALVPIREYMHTMHYLNPDFLQPLLKHFHKLLEIYDTYVGTGSNSGIAGRITSNFANIQNILVHSLNQDTLDLANSIYCVCRFDRFSRLTGHGYSPLMNRIASILPQLRDPSLEVYFIARLFAGDGNHLITNPRHLVERALQLFPQFDNPDLKCRLYSTATSYYRVHLGDLPTAMGFAQTGLALAISIGDTKGQSELLARLAVTQWQNGDYSAAQLHSYEAQRLAKISANLYLEAEALRIESICWYAMGNYSHSIFLLDRARDLLGLCDMSGSQLDHIILDSQAELRQLKSEYIEARSLQTQILHNVSKQGLHEHAMALLNIALIDVESGGSRDAIQNNIDMAYLNFRDRGYWTGMEQCDMVGAALAMREGDLSVAHTLLRKCLKFAWGKATEGVTYCLERLGEFHQWKTVDQTASTWTVTFLVHSLKTKQKLGIHQAFQFLGDVYISDGDRKTAHSLFTIALEGFTQMDVHRSRAECMLRLGDISTQDGEILKAADLWERARPLFECSSQNKQIAKIDQRLAEISRHLD
ncbi:hypothetical protein FB451DRAFT_1478078 [Mycena latifolia]|nr:hypothetical protein FB451DRAFT_1478078 [Mycena latifolia]